MTEPAPRPLYKYRSLAADQREFTRSIILDQKLWCGPASSLNDPFDCLPIPIFPEEAEDRRRELRLVLEGALAPKELEELLTNFLAAPPEHLDRLIRGAVEQNRQTIGVISFSAANDIDRMWNEYADYHRGICLGFSDQVDDHRMFSCARSVIYTPDRPSVEAVLHPGPDFRDAYVYSKTNNWAHEQEWRLVDPAKTRAEPFRPRALAVVVFGAAISDYDRNAVKGWVAEAGLELALMQARLSANGVLVEHDP